MKTAPSSMNTATLQIEAGSLVEIEIRYIFTRRAIIMLNQPEEDATGCRPRLGDNLSSIASNYWRISNIKKEQKVRYHTGVRWMLWMLGLSPRSSKTRDPDFPYQLPLGCTVLHLSRGHKHNVVILLLPSWLSDNRLIFLSSLLPPTCRAKKWMRLPTSAHIEVMGSWYVVQESVPTYQVLTIL